MTRNRRRHQLPECLAGLLGTVAVAQQWVPVDHAPAARERMGMVTDTLRNRIVMFGGGGREDTWLFDGAAWTLRPTTQRPPHRIDFGCAFDHARGQLVMFGGQTASNSSVQPTDLWLFDGATWSQVQPTVVPPGRVHPAMAYDHARAEVVLFGGYDLVSGLLRNDTWVWNGTTWQARSPAASPPALWFPAMAYDLARQRTVLVNCWYGAATWEWDGATWQQRATPPMVPRYGSALVYRPDTQRLLLFGGDRGVNTTMLDDTWEYDGSSWTQQPTSTAPPGRGWHGIAWDPIGRSPVIHGGRRDPNVEGNFDDTWRLVGSTWVRVPGLEEPRSVQSLTYDSSRGRFVALTGNQLPVQTWEFDGLWHRRPSPQVPSIGYYHPIAYDALRNRTWTWTGSPQPTTWAWDGSSWQTQATANSPPMRFGFALAHDPVRNVVVLFGGRHGANYDDTWEFDGVDWQQRTPLQSPPSLRRAALAFHPGTSRLVMFGGELSAGGYTNSTWEYDGIAWTLRTVLAAPPARAGAALVLDPATGHLVLSGGLGSLATGSPSLRDAWRWNGTTWLPGAPQEIGTSPWQCAAADPHNALMSDGERWWRWSYQPAAPPTATGTGCGSPSPSLTVGGRTFLGNPIFRMHVEPALADVLFALFADSATAAVPLGGGCTQYLSMPHLFCLGTTTSPGIGSTTLPIPRLPSLRGYALHVQGLVGQPNGPLQGVAALTSRLTLVLGD